MAVITELKHNVDKPPNQQRSHNGPVTAAHIGSDRYIGKLLSGRRNVWRGLFKRGRWITVALAPARARTHFPGEPGAWIFGRSLVFD